MKIVIATHNQAKFRRYQQLLKHIVHIELLSLNDIGISQKVDEPYHSARENAEHKAREYAHLTGLPTLAIDEATTTNFLPENEQPGVYVRRFANSNKEMTDQEALTHWREIFDNNPQNNKQFIWDFQIAFYDPKTNVLQMSNAVQVNTVASKFSDVILPGYPMSSFLIHERTSVPHSELTDEEKLQSDIKIFKKFISDFTQWTQT